MHQDSFKSVLVSSRYSRSIMLSPSTSMDLLLFRHAESRKNELAHEQIFGHVNISAGKQEAFKALKLV